MFVDDLADALIFLLRNYSGEEHVNVGVAEDVSIRELAETALRVVGHRAQIRLDPSRPDGTLRKLMDSSRLFAMGWRPKTSLEVGLRHAYSWYQENALPRHAVP